MGKPAKAGAETPAVYESLQEVLDRGHVYQHADLHGEPVSLDDLRQGIEQDDSQRVEWLKVLSSLACNLLSVKAVGGAARWRLIVELADDTQLMQGLWDDLTRRWAAIAALPLHQLPADLLQAADQRKNRRPEDAGLGSSSAWLAWFAALESLVPLLDARTTAGDGGALDLHNALQHVQAAMLPSEDDLQALVRAQLPSFLRHLLADPGSRADLLGAPATLVEALEKAGQALADQRIHKCEIEPRLLREPAPAPAPADRHHAAADHAAAGALRDSIADGSASAQALLAFLLSMAGSWESLISWPALTTAVVEGLLKQRGLPDQLPWYSALATVLLTRMARHAPPAAASANLTAFRSAILQLPPRPACFMSGARWELVRQLLALTAEDLIHPHAAGVAPAPAPLYLDVADSLASEVAAVALRLLQEPSIRSKSVVSPPLLHAITQLAATASTATCPSVASAHMQLLASLLTHPASRNSVIGNADAMLAVHACSGRDRAEPVRSSAEQCLQLVWVEPLALHKALLAGLARGDSSWLALWDALSTLARQQQQRQRQRQQPAEQCPMLLPADAAVLQALLSGCVVREPTSGSDPGSDGPIMFSPPFLNALLALPGALAAVQADDSATVRLNNTLEAHGAGALPPWHTLSEEVKQWLAADPILFEGLLSGVLFGSAGAPAPGNDPGGLVLAWAALQPGFVPALRPLLRRLLEDYDNAVAVAAEGEVLDAEQQHCMDVLQGMLARHQIQLVPLLLEKLGLSDGDAVDVVNGALAALAWVCRQQPTHRGHGLQALAAQVAASNQLGDLPVLAVAMRHAIVGMAKAAHAAAT